MKQLNVVVTSGNTREYIDDVRVLTNISSGKLGANIAAEFINHGHNVTYVAPPNAIMPSTIFTGEYSFCGTKDTQSVYDAMERLVPKADVVLMCMAVSDFTFDLDGAVKLSSGDPEAFIEHMRKTIKKTPKIISKFREWNPDAILVGFKFTVGKDYKELSEIAHNLLNTNKLNMVFANDKAQMKKAGEHVGMLITDVQGIEKPWVHKIKGKEAIAETIFEKVTYLAQEK